MVRRKYVNKKSSKEKNELIERRRSEILNAAMKVFAKHGFQHTDVEKIAALAGVGKGTVYRYFKSKENLFFSVVEWGLNILREKILNAINNAKSSMEKLKVALSTYFGFFEESRDFYRVLVEERTKSRLAVEKKWKQKHLSNIHLLMDILEDILRGGMKEGVFKKTETSSAAYALLGASNALLYKWLMSNKKYPIKSELCIIGEIYFSGILRKCK